MDLKQRSGPGPNDNTLKINHSQRFYRFLEISYFLEVKFTRILRSSGEPRYLRILRSMDHDENDDEKRSAGEPRYLRILRSMDNEDDEGKIVQCASLMTEN